MPACRIWPTDVFGLAYTMLQKFFKLIANTKELRDFPEHSWISEFSCNKMEDLATRTPQGQDC